MQTLRKLGSGFTVKPRLAWEYTLAIQSYRKPKLGACARLFAEASKKCKLDRNQSLLRYLLEFFGI